MKDLKKLKLNKETVTELCKGEMNHLKGGTDITITFMASYLAGCYKGGGGHTRPPRCCKYGCCETIGC